MKCLIFAMIFTRLATTARLIAATSSLVATSPALAGGAAVNRGDPFHGVVVPMVTPFDARRQPCRSGSHASACYVAAREAGQPALSSLSGLGQWRRLTLEEKKAVITTVVTAAAGRKPVATPGITSPDSLADTLDLAHFAEGRGAVAISVAIPETLRPKTGAPSRQAMFRFFKTVHDAVGIPLLIYDAQADLDPVTVRHLALLPRIKAIKYRTKNIVRFLAMTKAVGDRIAVLAGVEHEGVAALAAGAAGIVGGGADIFPQLIAAILERFQAGDITGARTATYAVMDANEGVPGAQQIKYALARYYGLAMTDAARGEIYQPLTLAQQSAVDTAMRRADQALANATTDRSRLAAAVARKQAVYSQLTKAAADRDGFVHNKCDGVTFTSLSCIARGLAKDDCPVYKAEDDKEPGHWFRHAQHDCFALDGQPGGSRSSNSPDMFIALGLRFWHYHDLASVERVIAYGEHHGWVMGEARASVRAATVVWSEDLKAPSRTSAVAPCR